MPACCLASHVEYTRFSWLHWKRGVVSLHHRTQGEWNRPIDGERICTNFTMIASANRRLDSGLNIISSIAYWFWASGRSGDQVMCKQRFQINTVWCARTSVYLLTTCFLVWIAHERLVQRWHKRKQLRFFPIRSYSSYSKADVLAARALLSRFNWGKRNSIQVLISQVRFLYWQNSA